MSTTSFITGIFRHSIQENQPTNSLFKSHFIFNEMGWDTTTMNKLKKKTEKMFFCLVFQLCEG